ncbi:MAG TPA: MmcQ/YjbR family DNA-binding protein [Polyangiaceae bacterium]|nr:MmcQ/YjbR family DNA-binding protein [Polyangiaceae bacterium]
MNPSTLRPAHLARIRTLCLCLPEATEREAWGDPTWRIKNKIFAMQKGNYHGGRPSLWLKAPEGTQDLLVKSNPDVFFVPPYVGSKGWVGIHLDGRIPWRVVKELVTESYKLIAPKRLAAALNA